jgi:hypothetical protein
LLRFLSTHGSEEKSVQGFGWKIGEKERKKETQKESSVRLRCRYEGSIYLGLKDIGWEGGDWTHMAQEGISG